MAEESRRVKVDTIFRVCPHCGYQDGFHSMFARVGGTDEFSWRFICPSCHQVFDIGLTVCMSG